MVYSPSTERLFWLNLHIDLIAVFARIKLSIDYYMPVFSVISRHWMS
jgi:hypothetical protein